MQDGRPQFNLAISNRITIILIVIVLGAFIQSCKSTISIQGSNEKEVIETRLPPSLALVSSPIKTPETTVVSPPPTVTPRSTSTPTPSPRPTSTHTATPTATPIGPCDQRKPADALLTLITMEYGLSRDFAPPDLVNLADYLPNDITLGYPTQVRRIIVDSLVQMVLDMQAAGLHPQIISGYRSYSSQAIAWEKWQNKSPETADIVSAPPGHSEHQLGTTIDFGSPTLASIVGDEEIEFHTYFYKTPEGQWLATNAHKYGFTLSYTRETFELTGMYYEPWHYRFVGQELAGQLFAEQQTLIQYLLQNQPQPCIP